MAVLAYIREHEGARPKQISDDLNLDYELTKKTCKRMEEDQQLDTDGRGRYFPPRPAVPAVPGVPAAGQATDSQDTRGDSCPLDPPRRSGRRPPGNSRTVAKEGTTNMTEASEQPGGDIRAVTG